MNTTESNRICVCCDAPFLPNKTDLCQRCEQRQSDKLDGLAAGAGICISVVGLVIALMAAAASCHGADSVAISDGTPQIVTGRIYSDLNHGWKKQQVSVVDDALLNKVAWVESRNNPKAVGKLGEIGMFQLRPIAIREVNRVYGTKYHIRDARKMVESREIARLYLLICESRCRVKTPANVYARYRGAR